MMKLRTMELLEPTMAFIRVRLRPDSHVEARSQWQKFADFRVAFVLWVFDGCAMRGPGKVSMKKLLVSPTN